MSARQTRKPRVEDLTTVAQRLDIAIAVAKTVVDALSDYAECESIGTTLQECCLTQLVAVRAAVRGKP